MRRRMSLTAKRSRSYTRAPLRPRWYWPAVQLSCVTAGTMAGLVTGAWLGWSGAVYAVTAGITTKALNFAGDAGLQVKAVYADGRRYTNRELLESQLGFAVGQSILSVDTDAAKVRLEALPWVAEASVGRLFPDTIKIRLQEHKPLAIWRHDGVFSLVDGDGGVIVSDLPVDDMRTHFGKLRLIIGDNAPVQAVDLFQMLATEPALSARVTAATWVGDRRWTLQLDNDIEILLPEDGALNAWRFLAVTDRERKLLDRAVTMIDLREAPDRMRLKLAPAAIEDQQA